MRGRGGGTCRNRGADGELDAMRLRLAAPAALLSLCCAAVPSLASSDAVRVDAVTADSVRGDLGAARGDWAQDALALAAARLSADAGVFRLGAARPSLVGQTVRGVQLRGGVPVQGGDATVVALGSRVRSVTVHEVGLPGTPAARPVGAAAARTAALAHLRVTALLVPAAVERAMVPAGGRLVDVYRVGVVAQRPARAAVVEVDAATGRVRAVRDEAQHVDGTAKVHDPNPIVTARDNTLRQPLEAGLPADVELPDAALDAQRRTLPLKELDPAALATGRLSGPYVDVVSGGYAGLTPDFDVTREDPRFEGLMSYAHLDRVQRYLQSLGFTGERAANAESQEVVAVPVPGYDNSFYQPANDVMVLGGGGVDDGEDADVIVHEYGHAIHDAQVPGWGETAEGGAMGEGFGDFLAASFFAPTSGGFQDECVAEWDSTSYSTTTPTCLRRVDGTKHYPQDVEDEVHADGEMWSAFLWRVRAQLGTTAQEQTDSALTLLLTSHTLLDPQADFGTAVRALRDTALAMGQPEWERVVVAEAQRAGFPLR